MNAHANIDTETFSNAIQGRADDLRSADTYERRVRVKCIEEIISEAKAKMRREDSQMENCARRKAAIADQITALQEQLATEEQAFTDHVIAWGDARIAMVKGYRELADLAEGSGQ